MNPEKKEEKKSKAGKVFFEQRKTKDRSTVWNAHNAKVEVFSWLRIVRRDLYIKATNLFSPNAQEYPNSQNWIVKKREINPRSSEKLIK